MIKIIMALTLGAASFVAGSCFAQTAKKQGLSQPLQIERLLSNPSGWAAVDWNDPDVLNDPRWIARTESQVQPNGTIQTDYREINALGSTNQRVLRWRTATPRADVLLSLSKDVPVDACENAAISFGKDLGVAISSNDTVRQYFSESSYMEISLRDWQWTTGNTRVGANCFGSFASGAQKESQLVLTITFQAVTRKPVLKPAFLLRCSQQVQLAIGGDSMPLRELVIWVSQDGQSPIRNVRFVPLGGDEPKRVDDYQIAFTFKDPNVTTKYVIDRVSGILSADAIQNGAPLGKITGTCAKSEATTKF